VNPSNIMLDDQLKPMLIDLDSCGKEGSPMGLKGGTPFWSKNTDVSVKENDFDGLERVACHYRSID